ncbi:tyrosine-type recombinase/integrase [Natronosalvus caseinilyticus]|uniref:tyrosine-type recombinase/integrase n=1 Tax=Natronosalvus caseinilyticus TaxID=2953747 RepID=UPI0028ABF303|nr:tyrosine-type recombinase/integrase [Natronosalvus caseinilyticus]
MSDNKLDANGYHQKVERELKNVKRLSLDNDDERKAEDLTVADLDGDAREIYLFSQYVRDDQEAASAMNLIARLRRLSEVSDKPLTECSPDDINALLGSLAEKNLGTGKTYKSSTKRKYLDAVTEFAENRGIDALVDIERPSLKIEKVDEDFILSKSEVWDLIESANNIRTKAIIAISWDCAWRVTALISLKVKDYTRMGSEYGLLQLPTKAEGLKGAGGFKKPVTVSKGYLENWLAEHPCQDDPEAALFCRMDKEKHYGEHMTGEAVRKHLKKAATNAGIDKDRVYPHAFRHARATYMKKSNDYSDLHIEHTLNWAEGSNEHKRYEHLDQDDKINAILRAKGIDAQDDDVDPEEIDCPQCQRKIPFDANRCPYCSMIIDDRPAEWFQLYREIVNEDDPVKKKYDEMASITPEIAGLTKAEFEHVREKFAMAVQLHDFGGIDYDDHRKNVEDYDWASEIDISGIDETDIDYISKNWVAASEPLARNFDVNETEYRLQGSATGLPVKDIEEDLDKLDN